MERVKGANSIESAASRNSLVKDARRIFELDWWRLLVGLVINHSIIKWLNFQVFPEWRLAGIQSKVAQIIKQRRESGRKVEDYLQLLLDAKLSDQVQVDEFDVKENHHASLTTQSIQSDHERLAKSINGQKSFMTDQEMLSNALFLMVVGLETTGNLLACCLYTLAFHKDIQQKLREEVQKIAARTESTDNEAKPMFDYESLTACQYLDALICETLRMMSPVGFTDRVCNADYRIDKYNIFLPKDSKILIHLTDIMNDSEYWPEPSRFDPERFMPENKDKIVPGSYCPFGLGPRHCLGMRFSLTESKLALAKLILRFKFTPAPNTNFPPEYNSKPGIRQIKVPLVNVEKL